MGLAFASALGDRKDITRFGSAYAPLDESLARAVVDLSRLCNAAHHTIIPTSSILALPLVLQQPDFTRLCICVHAAASYPHTACRPYASVNIPFTREKIGELSTEMLKYI